MTSVGKLLAGSVTIGLACWSALCTVSIEGRLAVYDAFYDATSVAEFVIFALLLVSCLLTLPAVALLVSGLQDLDRG